MDPLVTAALINTGGNLLGGFLGGGGDDKARYFAEANTLYNRRFAAKTWQFNKRYMMEARRREDNALQRRVRDANAAGLHPLYALGMSGGGGMAGGLSWDGPDAPSIYEDPQTGSFLGDAVSAVADGWRDYNLSVADRERQERDDSRQERLDDANVKAAEARAARDEAEAALALSEVARATQAANHTRAGDTTTVTGYGVPAPGVHERPVEHLPNQTAPAYVPGYGPHGRQVYDYMNPALGGDEGNEIIGLLNRMADSTVWSRDVLSDALLTIFGPRAAAPRNQEYTTGSESP